jgi:fibronectin-binding autotransporter adhesin
MLRHALAIVTRLYGHRIVSTVKTLGIGNLSMAKIDWINSQGGLWTSAANWSGGAVPGAGDDVIINVPPAGPISYDIQAYYLDLSVHSLTLDQTGAELDLVDTTLAADVVLAAGTLSLQASSTLSGTLYQTGGTLSASFGTLSGETIEGSVRLDGFDTTITGGLTLAALHHTAATLSLLGGPIDVIGTQTWDGGTLLLSNLGQDYGIDLGLNLVDSGSVATTLTLGRHLDLAYSGSNVIGDGATASGAVVNDGRISGEGGALFLAEASIVNAGLISAAQGDLVSIEATRFVNRGTMTVSDGGTLSIAATRWSSAGLIDVAGGTLALAGANVDIDMFGRATYTLGGSASLQGTIENAHRTLTLGEGTGLPFISLGGGGLISGGTVVTGGGLGYSGGVLQGVTIEGTLDMSAANSTAEITGGLALRPVESSGAGTLLLTGSGSSLALAGTQTFRGIAMEAGAGTVGSGGIATLSLSEDSVTILAASSSLRQVGANLMINTLYGDDGSVAPLLVNDGVITATVTGGLLTCNDIALDNAGMMILQNEEFNYTDYSTPSSPCSRTPAHWILAQAPSPISAGRLSIPAS